MKKIRSFFISYFGIPVLISNIIGVILGISLWVLDSNIYIPVWIFLSTTSLLIFIIWILLLKICSPNTTSHPFNLDIVKFHVQPSRTLCILKPSEYIAYGTYVTFFYKSDGIESYLCTGVVINIQNDHFIQVKLLDISSLCPYTEMITSNNIDFIQSLFIKPIVTDNFLKERN